MSETMQIDEKTEARRRFLTATVGVIGAAGAAAMAVPIVSQMRPSARAQAAGAPVEVDISKLQLGQLLTVEWRGKPIWILKRTEETLAFLAKDTAKLADPESKVKTQQPEYAKNPTRSIKEDLLVLIGICTHLGCSPTYRPELAPADLGHEWHGGFFCPCHGSKFDLAGRVYKGVPAPTNLVVPPYSFVDEENLIIGVDGDEA